MVDNVGSEKESKIVGASQDELEEEEDDDVGPEESEILDTPQDMVNDDDGVVGTSQDLLPEGDYDVDDAEADETRFEIC